MEDYLKMYELEIIYLDANRRYVSKEFRQNLPKDYAEKLYKQLQHTQTPSLIVMRTIKDGLWNTVRTGFNEEAKKLWK